MSVQEAITQFVTLFVVIDPAATAVVVLIFFAAEPVYRVIGRGGLGTMSRVMGLILSSIAVTNGVTAIKLVFGLD